MHAASSRYLEFVYYVLMSVYMDVNACFVLILLKWDVIVNNNYYLIYLV